MLETENVGKYVYSSIEKIHSFPVLILLFIFLVRMVEVLAPLT